MTLGKQHRDIGDFTEQIQVRCQTGDCTVQEHHVLYVQHQFLGHSRAVSEQCLHDALHFLHELLTRQRCGVYCGLVEAQVFDDRINVGVHRQCTKVAERRNLPLHIVGRCTEHQPQKCHATNTGEATDDAEVE